MTLITGGNDISGPLRDKRELPKDEMDVSDEVLSPHPFRM